MRNISNNIISQLQKIDVAKLKMANGRTVEQELRRHAAILADCIQWKMDKMYDSYTPKQYHRTYGLYNSLYIDDKLIFSTSAKGDSLEIHLGFDDGAVHRGFDGQLANTAVLLNNGFSTHGSFANVPYFGYRDGYYFVERGVESYKRQVSNPFRVEISK